MGLVGLVGCDVAGTDSAYCSAAGWLGSIGMSVTSDGGWSGRTIERKGGIGSRSELGKTIVSMLATDSFRVWTEVSESSSRGKASSPWS